MEGRNTWKCDCGASYKQVGNKWEWMMENKDNVISLFAKKDISESKETPEEIVARFHLKLDEVLCEFQTLGVMEKFEVMQSVVEMNKQVFSLYMDLKRRTEV